MTSGMTLNYKEFQEGKKGSQPKIVEDATSTLKSWPVAETFALDLKEPT